MKSFISNTRNLFEKYDYVIVLTISVILSLVSFFYVYDQSLITAYGDSSVHLNIARRTIESVNVGLGQLVGSWLPLLHVLMLPSIWNDFLWYSGISGSIVNMLAYIVAVFYSYQLGYILTGKRLGGVIAFLFIAFNINILYFQSTPMTEVLFIGTLIPALYHLYKWHLKSRLSDLLFAGIFLGLTSLNRYEGWPIAIASLIVVFLIAMQKEGKRKAEGIVFLYGTLTLFGIFIWLLLQFLIYGNPTAFLTNEYAAGVNTAREIEEGLVPTYGNPYLSFLTQIYTIIHIAGLIATVMFLIGCMVVILRAKFNPINPRLLILFLALVPFFFEVLVLFRGIVPTYVPEIRIDHYTPEFFNHRYAIYSMPAMIIAILSISNRKVVLFSILFLIVANNVLISPFAKDTIAALNDASIITSQEKMHDALYPEDYDGGKILISAASSDSLILSFGLKHEKFITEGAGVAFKESLENPGQHVSWIIINNHSKDTLLRGLNMERLENEFHLHTEIIRGDKWFYRAYKKGNLPVENHKQCIQVNEDIMCKRI